MNLAERLIHLDREAPKRVLVAGDGMVDVYVPGAASECQDGCAKFTIKDGDVVREGGAGNAANCLRNWNANVVRVVPYCACKRRYVDADGKILFRVDEDYGFTDHGGLDYRKILLLEAQLADAVLLSDYEKGFLTPEFIYQVASVCRERGVPCVADAKREPGVYAGCVLKCNDKYLEQFDFEVSPAFLPNYVITHGAKTPVVCRNYEVVRPRMAEKHSVRCASHVGAGDCFAAHLVLGLAHGFSLEDAAAVAHSAGRVYVQRLWNTPPRPEEVARDFAGEGAIVE